MGETGDTVRPIWRTPLAAVLVAWMLLVVGMALGSWTIAERTSSTVLIGLLVTGGVLPAIGLLVWGFWGMLREPLTGWIAPTALLTFCGALVPAYQPLSDAAARFNFEAHRPVYEAIVEEARGGRLAANPDGWVQGARAGVRYRFRIDRPRVIDFVWMEEAALKAGVRYSDIACKPSPGLKCIDRGRPLAPHYFHYWEIL